MMKEAITCLGVALDTKQIDSEGSKLLDFALNAFALDLGCLSTRCLLCRRGGQKLRNSHIWPNFFLKKIQKGELSESTKPFLFGKNIFRPKFSKECTYYMFCSKCEEILNQNGEHQFAKLLDSLQKAPHDVHCYGNWLYNFAIGIIFRELTTESMSYVVNEKELYNCFLLCRRHLFTLSIKVDNKCLPPYSEEEGHQFQNICADITTCSDLAVYLMNCPAKQMSSKDKMIHYYSEYCYFSGSIATCRLSDAKLDLSGRVHFLQIYLNGFHFLVKFKASENYSINDHLLIPPQLAEAQKCAIPIEDVDTIPEGVWSVLRQAGSMSFNTRMKFYHDVSDLTLYNLTKSNSPSFQPVDFSTERSQPEILTNDKIIQSNSTSMLSLPSLYTFNLLPNGFSICMDKPGASLSLPEAHKVVLHLSGQVDGELLTTYFLCVNSSIDFYLLFLYCGDSSSGYKIIDGVNITAEDEPVVSSFLFEDRPRMESLPHPFSIPEMQAIVDQQLPSLLSSKGIKSMNHLVHLLHCRR